MLGAKGADDPPAVKCDYMGKGSAYYDLSSLRGTLFTLDDIRGNDRGNTFTYKMSLCANINLAGLPSDCAKSTGTNPPEPGTAFQVATSVTDVTGCFRLGQLNAAEWSLIDDDDPEKGVELAYKGGEMCSNERAREIRYHFICADGFPKDSPPLFAFETSGAYCHYNITWPTILGCPVYHTSFAWSMFGLKMLFMAIILYFLSGCIYIHVQHKKDWGWDSMPNASLWAKVVDWMASKISCLSFMKRTGEHGEDDEGSASRTGQTSTDAEDFERRFPMHKDPPPTPPVQAPGGVKHKK